MRALSVGGASCVQRVLGGVRSHRRGCPVSLWDSGAGAGRGTSGPLLGFPCPRGHRLPRSHLSAPAESRVIVSARFPDAFLCADVRVCVR